MKKIATISTMILAATLAVAQAAPAKTTPKKPAAPASQSSTGKAAMPTTPASTTAAKSTTAKKTAKKPATTAMAKPTAAKPAENQSAEDVGKGKRDPFVSPVITRIVGAGGPACSSGPHCLVIDQVTLQGTVKTEKGWIAVLANPAKKVYYLRLNDAMFDGYIERIDANSV